MADDPDEIEARLEDFMDADMADTTADPDDIEKMLEAYIDANSADPVNIDPVNIEKRLETFMAAEARPILFVVSACCEISKCKGYCYILGRRSRNLLMIARLLSEKLMIKLFASHAYGAMPLYEMQSNRSWLNGICVNSPSLTHE